VSFQIPSLDAYDRREVSSGYEYNPQQVIGMIQLHCVKLRQIFEVVSNLCILLDFRLFYETHQICAEVICFEVASTWILTPKCTHLQPQNRK